MNARRTLHKIARFAFVIAVFALSASPSFAASDGLTPAGAEEIIIVGG